MTTAKPAPRPVVVIGNVNRFALRKYVTATDKVIHAQRPAYYGSRNGADDATWTEHKAARNAIVADVAYQSLVPVVDALDADKPVVVVVAAGWDAYDAQSGIFPQTGAVDVYRDFLDYADAASNATVVRMS